MAHFQNIGALLLRNIMATTAIVTGTALFIAGCNNSGDNPIGIADDKIQHSQEREHSCGEHSGSGKGAAVADVYANVNPDLISNETYGVDYTIASRNKIWSQFLFATIHGGSIESGTTELADVSAGNEYDYYTFTGIKDEDNFYYLHVTSTNFNESTGLTRIGAASKAIVLHGCENPGTKYTGTNSNTNDNKSGASGSYKVAWVGGLDTVLRNSVITKLRAAGFCADIATGSLAGTSASNFTNKTTTGKGCQIEITKDLRKNFFTNNDYSSDNRGNRTARFTTFTNALRAAASQAVQYQ